MSSVPGGSSLLGVSREFEKLWRVELGRLQSGEKVRTNHDGGDFFFSCPRLSRIFRFPNNWSQFLEATAPSIVGRAMVLEAKT